MMDVAGFVPKLFVWHLPRIAHLLKNIDLLITDGV